MALAYSLLVHLGVLFVARMALHSEIARLTPALERLTSCYVAIAAGAPSAGRRRSRGATELRGPVGVPDLRPRRCGTAFGSLASRWSILGDDLALVEADAGDLREQVPDSEAALWTGTNGTICGGYSTRLSASSSAGAATPCLDGDARQTV